MSGRTAPKALQAAISDGLLGPCTSLVPCPALSQNLALFYDLEEFEAGFDRAVHAFGDGFLHAMAVKANPVTNLLKIVNEKGHGIECASIGEVLHGMEVGFSAKNIVFDSPVKTLPELKFCLEKGVHLNVDNFQELECITQLIEEMGGSTESTVGIRINPDLGLGEVAALSVCTPDSKFGVLLTDETRPGVIDWYRTRPWLNCVHIHVGSQGFGIKQLTGGARVAVDFALEINKALGRNQVEVIDIGGGMPVNRKDDTASPTFEEYATMLREVVPELFPDYGIFKRIVTEFGQALNAKSAWLASKVEYTKRVGHGITVALIHAGADLCMRTCYMPGVDKYARRVQVFDSKGKPKSGEESLHNIAGPLCFSGDVVKREVMLPKIEKDDFVVIHDCGANSVATFSRHCSRLVPSVIGYRVQKDGVVKLEVLKEAETVADLITFWRGASAKSA